MVGERLPVTVADAGHPSQVEHGDVRLRERPFEGVRPIVGGYDPGDARRPRPVHSVVELVGQHGSHHGHEHSHDSHHAVTPSQATKTLQSQLAQLNYYNGPISGYWNSDTTNAVDFLQASAHLPQTGSMNTATQAALNYQLAHGGNQMNN